MTRKSDSPEGGQKTIWTALAIYAAAGWAAAEILLAIRERYGLPETLDNVVLGILLAGLAATGIVLATGRLAGNRPIVSVLRIFAVVVVGCTIALGVSAWLGESEQMSQIPSVAVLPCEFQGDADRAFLGPAAAQELHARLAKVSGIQIPAWRSVLKSARVGKDKAQIADLLHVGNLTTCEIREDENGIELSASILDPDTEDLVWSGRHTYASADLVQALGDISLAIADALSVRLTADESDRVTRAPTSSPEAYEQYLRARQAQGSRQFTIPNMLAALAVGEEDYKTAMKHYRAAVDLDPDFAEAWAGMGTVTEAFAYTAPGQSVAGNLERSYTEQAKDFARHALTLAECNAEALLLTRPRMSETDVDDQITQTGDSWGDVYQRLVAQVQRAIDCEPNNASAWLKKTQTYTYFALWPSAGTQYPAEETRDALKKALSLDPTNCPVVAYYIGIVRSPFWAPRPEDRLNLEETKQAIRSALFVDPECGDMYDILYRISVEQGRMDEAIAWKMRRYELDPENVFITCEIGMDLNYLGFPDAAQPWIDRANDAGLALWCMNKTDFECMASRDVYFSERCKAHRLEKAKQTMASDFGNASDREQVFRYQLGLYQAQSSDRPDLLRQWLHEGLEWLGTDDPVAILGKNPKRLISARTEGLQFVPIFRDLGLDDAADRMLELCRRDPDDPEQIVFNMDLDLYVDAQQRALAGKKAEAMELLTRAVREHQMGPYGSHFPDRGSLMFDRTLDPLREDPEYAPRLEALIEEYDAWLAPAKQRAAKAIETDDWASLRTLIDDTQPLLADSSRADD